LPAIQYQGRKNSLAALIEGQSYRKQRLGKPLISNPQCAMLGPRLHVIALKRKPAAERMRRPPLPDTANRRWAWFLDVDGTLLEIEAYPDLVTADTRLLGLLERLRSNYGGALALVSGRSLEQLDRIFGHVTLAAAASHGLEQRLPDGTVLNRAGEVPSGALRRITEFAERHAGLVVEQKPFSVGLHYRARPELEEAVLEAMEKIHAELDNDVRLMHGKMVVEIMPAGAHKGSAIRAFMRASPFEGRLPVFVGDDVTDEYGFAAVNELGGMSIRVGAAAGSAAKWQLTDVADLRAWLKAAADIP
jgi:trehalose 6-phosphate phosphatase